MTDLRHRPGAFAQDPRGSNGLVGRAAVDMRLRTWGEFEAISQGFGGYWRMRCLAKGHEALLNGTSIRREDKLGRPAKCKECGR